MNLVAAALAWLRRNRDIFSQWDFRLAAFAGGIIFFVAIVSSELRDRAVSLLVVEAGLGVALLAVALTALAILVGLLDDHYVQILERAGGLHEAFQPYKITAAIGGGTTILTLIILAGWNVDVLPDDIAGILRAVGIGTTMCGTVWGVAATIQLVDDTAFHGLERGELIRGIREARQLARNDKVG